MKFYMNKPIYFDSNALLGSDPSPSAFSKKLAPHFFSKEYQPKEILLNQKYYLEEIFRLLGAENFYQIGFFGDLASAGSLIAMDHYKETIFSSGKSHVSLCSGSFYIKLGFDHLKELGCQIHEIQPNDSGLITKEQLYLSINQRTSFVSICAANPLTGVIHPIEELAKVCKERKILFHVDITDLIGKKYFSLKEIGADYYSFNARSFGGPENLVCVIKSSARSDDCFLEKESYANLYEPLKGALYAAFEKIDEIHLEISRFRKLFEKKIVEQIEGAKIIFSHTERLPTTTLVYFPKVSAQLLCYLLYKEKVFVTTYDPRFGTLQDQISSYFDDPFIPWSCLMFSFSSFTSKQEVEQLEKKLIQCYERALMISKGACDETS